MAGRVPLQLFVFHSSKEVKEIEFYSLVGKGFLTYILDSMDGVLRLSILDIAKAPRLVTLFNRNSTAHDLTILLKVAVQVSVGPV